MAYCHCTDCRRWTGGPVSAFAAFAETAMAGQLPDTCLQTGGVRRWTCPACGSPLGAAFDYLEGQIYVPLGIMDQAETLAPTLHSHHGSRLPWLHIADDLPRSEGTARDDLLGSTS
ncbi:GFA family protein [Tateyamaria armeniaca]|uniref:GFA family protein n=1 Tax=Tateyamaria armeniaca TaxID=2518930 RepID=A0ABW8USE2_9RHOB